MTDYFDDIRPYNQQEAGEAIKRIGNSPFLPQIKDFLFPELSFEEFKKQFLQLKNTDEFQTKIMDKAIRSIVEQTSSKLEFDGFQHLHKKMSYMFLSNHRDILLDSAILQILLKQHHHKTSEITFGSNLMMNDFVVDVGKINKMFKIYREGNFREFYKNSVRVSAYMRYAITEKNESVWIAQRNGRTKNGDDQTEIGVLKMFAMSSSEPFVENLAELNITPLSISYEFEPCDFMKAREIYISRRIKYIKAPNEDLNSVLHGIKQWKGGIHLSIGKPVSKDHLLLCDQQKDKFKALASHIDHEIYKNYKLWPNNYIAYDMLINSDQYHEQYTDDQKAEFISYMNNGLEKLEGDREELRDIFLHIYGNPVKNNAL